MNKSVLFIDDERWAVNSYFAELKQKGVECILARDGDEAIRELERRSVDLIVMDVMFPAGVAMGDHVANASAGLQLLLRIRTGNINNCRSDIPVIVLTAVVHPNIEKQIVQAKVSDYLKKPEEHHTVIAKILERLADEHPECV